jgi:hypothetical protein
MLDARAFFTLTRPQLAGCFTFDVPVALLPDGQISRNVDGNTEGRTEIGVVWWLI